MNRLLSVLFLSAAIGCLMVSSMSRSKPDIQSNLIVLGLLALGGSAISYTLRK